MHFKKLNLLAILLLCLGLEAKGQKRTPAYSWQNLPGAELPSFKADTFNIEKFGAEAGKFTNNTQSINTAINECSKHGGGVVFIPPGFWLTGPIVMKNNVNLHLSKAAVLQFTSEKALSRLLKVITKDTSPSAISLRSQARICKTSPLPARVLLTVTEKFGAQLVKTMLLTVNGSNSLLPVVSLVMMAVPGTLPQAMPKVRAPGMQVMQKPAKNRRITRR